MSQGVSKKLCVTVIGLYMVSDLAKDDPLVGTIVIGVMCCIYKAVQGWIDVEKDK